MRKTMSIQERMGKEGRGVPAQQAVSSQVVALPVQGAEPFQYFPALSPVHVFVPAKSTQLAEAEKKERKKQTKDGDNSQGPAKVASLVRTCIPALAFLELCP